MTLPCTPSERAVARPRVVPYVVPWSGEPVGPERELTVEYHRGRPRLAYTVPRSTDRDRAGVLWVREAHAPGTGQPAFGQMHVQRQYACMYALKCQVCGETASRNQDGYLFLDWADPDDPSWPEGTLTGQPPVCEKCARLATRLCPHATHFVALRVRLPRLWGVAGTAYTWTDEGWVSNKDIPALRYGDERLNAVVASQLVRQLRKVKVADLP